MNGTEKAMYFAAGVALIFTVSAIGMTAFQALGAASGSSVVPLGIVVVTGLIGMAGLAAFGLLWLTQTSKKS